MSRLWHFGDMSSERREAKMNATFTVAAPLSHQPPMSLGAVLRAAYGGLAITLPDRAKRLEGSSEGNIP